MDRRGFLRVLAGGTLAGGGLAGCSGLPGTGTEPEREQATQFHPAREPEEWTQTHYDSAHTRRIQQALDFDGEERWHFRPRHRVAHAVPPLAADGQVYLAYKAPRGAVRNSRPRLLAIDANTGTRQWRRSGGDWQGGFTPRHGPLPTVYGDLLYFGPNSGSNALFAIAAGSGSTRWTAAVGGGRQTVVPAAGLLHVVRPESRHGSRRVSIAALDPLKGTARWETTFEAMHVGHPTFDGSSLYYPIEAVPEGGDEETTIPQVVSVDPDTGRERGRFARGMQSQAPFSGGMLFTAEWGSERIAAIDTADGSLDWERPVQFSHQMDQGDVQVVNARYNFGGVADDRLVVHKKMHGFVSDELWGLDPTSGDVEWRITPPTADDRVEIFNQPIVAGRHLFVTGTVNPTEASRTGFLRQFDLGTGEEVLAMDLPSPCFVPPIVADGQVVVVGWDGVRGFR
ncbi:MAG: PQQ-binding-like beta-propeller repeat protein [Halodesulfurarchaeum sp.]